MPETTEETESHKAEGRPGHAALVLHAARDWTLWLFLSANERRLRAGWRLMAHLLLLGVIGGAAVAGLSLALALAKHFVPRIELSVAASLGSPTPIVALAFALTGAITITVTVWMARRLFDRRSFVSLGLALDRRTAPELALGFLLAGAMQGLIFVSLWGVGWLRVTGFSWQTLSARAVLVSAVTFVFIFALVAWYEELLSRGYWLQNMADGLNRPLAVLISSSIFALGHIGNPNATWAAVAGIVGAGLLLAWAYVRTGRLWLAIGLHFGWNLFEGFVFGFPVSGTTTASLIRITVNGPARWTGREFGPEAGLVALPVLAAGAIVIGLVTRDRTAAAPAAVD
jgi:uncharacterized protein